MILNKNNKPLGWYFHRVLCEIGWKLRNIKGCDMYYSHLNKLCKYGYNLYGYKIDEDDFIVASKTRYIKNEKNRKQQ